MHNQNHHETTISKVSSDRDWINSSVMLVASYLPRAAFYILQIRTVKLYPAPITLTSLTGLSGTLLSTLLTPILDHKASSCRLSWNITLLAPAFSVRI
ncbi:hypothetical protein FEM48_Zijuj04G0153100 [Ziziphus jujuba var. spinosa]|uniref:Uncharacterized protein n=1 Tax=Ziziphus jujuba var. spinosa TaxID=714518 RepID=A0A978VKM1_ZIZJJ|nr:hypothetical protein FEM48_Zijuj04G0153100 [Ziziphus jujuba var. spinosa]